MDGRSVMSPKMYFAFKNNVNDGSASQHRPSFCLVLLGNRLAKPLALCDDDIHPKAESRCSDLILRIALS
jgi:hypothetical protein